MNVELRHLRTLIAVAETGNLTRAAELLHLSQPAVSRTITQLEQAVGVRLVDRTTRSVSLTAAGEDLLTTARNTVGILDEGIRRLAADSGPIRLGYTWATTRLVAALGTAWADQHPSIPLVPVSRDDRTAGVEAGLTDVALVRSHPADPRLRSRTLCLEPRVAAIHRTHDLATRECVSLADLTDGELVVNPEAGTTTPELWPAAHRPTVATEVATTNDWLVAIASGVGFGVTAESSAETFPHPDVRYVPIDDAPPVSLIAIWREPPSHPAGRSLIDLASRLVDDQ